MQMPSPLDLEDYPDSPYARELRGNVPPLRFSPDLENDFQAFHLARVRARVRAFQLAILALAIIAAGQIVLTEGVQGTLAARFGLIITAGVFLVWAAWSRHYQRLYIPVARFAVPVFAIVSAVDVAHRMMGGHPDQFSFLTTYSFAIFFLEGLLFHQALIANAAMVFAHGVTLAVLTQSPATVAFYTAILAVTGVAGALVYRGVERELRTSFLERGLMGEMAARDSLTGLKNRGAFDDCFPRIWQHALRERRSLSVLMIDVDHFKTYNDRFGHQAGDQALRRVAQVVQSHARRPLDMAARYGGEEFVLALFDLKSEHVRQTAEELREAVQKLSIVHPDSDAAQVVTVSIGASIVRPTHERSPEGAVQLADEALYGAKRTGRNRAVIMESEYHLLSTGSFRRSRLKSAL